MPGFGVFRGFCVPLLEGWCVPQAVDTVGEILLSLSYLPTAERLTVVVVKAKNLVWSNGKVTAGEQGAHPRASPCCLGVPEPPGGVAGSTLRLFSPGQIPSSRSTCCRTGGRSARRRRR